MYYGMIRIIFIHILSSRMFNFNMGLYLKVSENTIYGTNRKKWEKKTTSKTETRLSTLFRHRPFFRKAKATDLCSEATEARTWAEKARAEGKPLTPEHLQGLISQAGGSEVKERREMKVEKRGRSHFLKKKLLYSFFPFMLPNVLLDGFFLVFVMCRRCNPSPILVFKVSISVFVCVSVFCTLMYSSFVFDIGRLRRCPLEAVFSNEPRPSPTTTQRLPSCGWSGPHLSDNEQRNGQVRETSVQKKALNRDPGQGKHPCCLMLSWLSRLSFLDGEMFCARQSIAWMELGLLVQ